MNGYRSATLIVAALASVVGCYSISLRAGNERAAIIAAQAQIARDTADMRLLRAELRTRSRLPQLQQWNEQVLALSPPRAEQLIANSVMLPSYAAPVPAVPSTNAMTVTAVVRDAPAEASAIHLVSFVPRIARNLGADAAIAGTSPALVQIGFRKVAVR